MIEKRIQLTSFWLVVLSPWIATFGSTEALFDKDGYALPQMGHAFDFPRDHGSHPAFKTEWWYITGHLESKEDEGKYGFQITFFRSATRPQGEEASAAMPEHIYMAHAALLDKKTGAYIHEERFNRSGWNADASVEGLDVFNGNWRLQMLDSKSEKMETSFSIKGKHRLVLEMTPAKPKVLFGDNGVSRKGEDPTAKSYYITFPRLQLKGSLEVDGKPVAIEGLAWMDHEISSSQLSPGQIGWNWTSAIFDDGTELMAYVMRREDGKTDPFSQLYLIDKESRLTSISSENFSWEPIEYWKSDDTGGNYPIKYRIRWVDENGDSDSIVVATPHPSQELIGAIGDFAYWEGAGIAYNESGKRVGQVYTELTGYNKSLYGTF